MSIADIMKLFSLSAMLIKKAKLVPSLMLPRCLG